MPLSLRRPGEQLLLSIRPRWVAAATAAIGATVQARRNNRVVRKHLARRLLEVRTAMAAAEPGFLFLAGNSHAEILGGELARRQPLVNGGIGGTSALGYAAQLAHLPFRTRAGTAVLILGTNDIIRKAKPLSPETSGRFAAMTAHILVWLRGNADRVLVAAVPPIGPEAATIRDPAAVAAYSHLLRQLCATHGCRFFDPFEELRDGADGLTSQATPEDGVHFRNYPALAATLAALLPRSSPAQGKSL